MLAPGCDLMSKYRRYADVMTLTSRFQRCSNIVYTTFIVHRELNLLSNVEATLEQPCNSDTVTTSLQRLVLIVQFCDSTR